MVRKSRRRRLSPPCLVHRLTRRSSFQQTEPQESWTVEEVLQWCLLQSHKATDEAFEQLVDSLRQQLAQGEQEIWTLYEEVAAGTDNAGPNDNDNNGVQSSAMSSKSMTSTTSSAAISVEIFGTGPYAGKTFTVNPKKNAPCMVGRSAGKKFRERGISFRKDPEVSTTHAKFEKNGSKYYYVDMGSTNGTRVGEDAIEELEPDVPYELSTGTILTCGQSFMKITIL